MDFHVSYLSPPSIPNTANCEVFTTSKCDDVPIAFCQVSRDEFTVEGSVQENLAFQVSMGFK